MNAKELASFLEAVIFPYSHYIEVKEAAEMLRSLESKCEMYRKEWVEMKRKNDGC